MLEKVRERGHQDPLFFHKIGLAGGAFVGLFIGLLISDRAENYDKEIKDGESIIGELAEQQPDNGE